MFANNNQETAKSREVETIIGSSVKVEGNFTCQGNIIIDGEVHGKVKTNGFLSVGNQSVIVAEVKAGDAKVSGEIRGNIKVKGYLELSSTAKIFGDIETGSLSVAKGAILNGKISMSGGEKESLKIKEDKEDKKEK